MFTGSGEKPRKKLTLTNAVAFAESAQPIVKKLAMAPMKFRTPFCMGASLRFGPLAVNGRIAPQIGISESRNVAHTYGFVSRKFENSPRSRSQAEEFRSRTHVQVCVARSDAAHVTEGSGRRRGPLKDSRAGPLNDQLGADQARFQRRHRLDESEIVVISGHDVVRVRGTGRDVSLPEAIVTPSDDCAVGA